MLSLIYFLNNSVILDKRFEVLVKTFNMDPQLRDMEKSLFQEKRIESLLSERIAIEDITERCFGTDVVVAGFIKKIKKSWQEFEVFDFF
jgi:hypothetical protein